MLLFSNLKAKSKEKFIAIAIVGIANHRNLTRNKAKKIKSDNFTKSNIFKSNIAIAILEI